MADPAARHARVAAKAESAVIEVLRSGRYVGGPMVEQVQRRVSADFGWRFGATTNSGTDALLYALLALGVGPGDEVIVPAVTFFATAGAVCRAGAVPVVADVRADEPLLSCEALPRSTRTRAIIAVHLFGAACRVDTDLPVLDDLAQCAGGTPCPRNGTIGAVSFYPTKTLGAAGDAGMVLTDDERTWRDLLRLTHHGMPLPNVHERVRGAVGANSRMDALQAALLLAHLDDLPARIARRRAIARRYDAELPAWIRPLSRAESHPVHHWVARTPARDRLRTHLAERGVESAIYYPIPLSRQPALQGIAHAPTPNADAFCASALALPVHECLSDDDVGVVIDAVGTFSP
jgi:dTDP-4-amino-4,6-dideoxygalactose transaminase